MAAYLIVQISIRDEDAYERYKQLAPQSIAQYGGRYLVRGGATHILEGTWHPARLVVLEFPSVEQSRAWWESPEYAEAKALRHSCAATEMLVVEGLSPIRSGASAYDPKAYSRSSGLEPRMD